MNTIKWVAIIPVAFPIKSAATDLRPMQGTKSRPDAAYPAVNNYVEDYSEFFPGAEVTPSSTFSIDSFLDSHSVTNTVDL